MPTHRPALRIVLLAWLAAAAGIACAPSPAVDKYEAQQDWLRATQDRARAWADDRTVLAAWRGRTVTRADALRYAATNYGLEAVVGSVNRGDCFFSAAGRQRAILDELFERALFLAEATNRGWHADPEFRRMMEWADHKLLIALHYRALLAAPLEFSEPGLRVRHLFLRFPGTVPDYRQLGPAGLPAEAREIVRRAEALRARALAGEDFAALCAEAGEDFTKAQSGELGWIARDSMGEEYWNAASRLAPGAVCAPVVSETGVYLVAVLERGTLSGSNYRRLLHDRFAYQLDERLRKDTEKRSLAALELGPGVLLDLAALAAGGPGATVARVGEWSLSLADFEREFGAFVKGYKPESFSPDKRREWRERFLRQYLVGPRLIVRDALARGLDKTDAYRAAVRGNAELRARILYIETKDRLFRSQPGALSIEQVRAVYEKHKLDRYARLSSISKETAGKLPKDQVVEKEGGYYKKEVRPFDELKAEIAEQVLRDLRYALLDEFIAKKKAEWGFKVEAADRFVEIRWTGRPAGK